MKGNKGKQITRRYVLGGLMAGTGQAVLAGAPLSSLHPVARPESYRKPLVHPGDGLIKAAGLSGKVGFVVADARTGLILEARNPTLGLPPASVAKALTAQYALEILGADHTFKTRLIATGPVVSGRVEGDLVLMGGGDPTLDTNDLAEMAAQLKAAGVREISGRFRVHGGALPSIGAIDKSQPEYLGYNPAISGLNLNYNRVYFEWKKTSGTYRVTMDARSDKYRPRVSIAKMEIVKRAAPIYTYADQNGVDSWTVAHKALGNGGARWLPVRKPEYYASEVFQILARSHGIVLKPAIITPGPVNGTVLVELQSQPLRKILKNMLKYSTNLTAEVVGLSASVVGEGRKVAGLRTSARAMSLWAASSLNARKTQLVDHSGLGGRSRVSASDMVNALVRIGPDSDLATMLKPIPMRDSKGNVLHKSPIKIHAKTGTLNFVSGLAGYIRAADGSDLAFAIFSADMERRRAIPDAERERPRGARGWNNRAHRVQRNLIARWAKLYGT